VERPGRGGVEKKGRAHFGTCSWSGSGNVVTWLGVSNKKAERGKNRVSKGGMRGRSPVLKMLRQDFTTEGEGKEASKSRGTPQDRTRERNATRARRIKPAVWGKVIEDAQKRNPLGGGKQRFESVARDVEGGGCAQTAPRRPKYTKSAREKTNED